MQSRANNLPSLDRGWGSLAVPYDVSVHFAPMIEIAQEIPAVMRFSRDVEYTFLRGPNAGRALKYLGQAEHPFQEFVKVTTADGRPFGAPEGHRDGHCLSVCKPADLVVK